MPGRNLEKLDSEALRRKLEAIERELKSLRGQLSAVREWLEDLEALHARLTIEVYYLKTRLEGGGVEP